LRNLPRNPGGAFFDHLAVFVIGGLSSSDAMIRPSQRAGIKYKRKMSLSALNDLDG
jgi:hypothetical protein